MSDETFVKLAWVMDKQVQGVPKDGGDISPAFVEYIKLMFSAEEAELALHLDRPPRMKPAAAIAQSSGKDEAAVAAMLRAMADRGSIMRLGEVYALHLIPNFLNILMYDDKVDDLNIKAAELYQDYFIKHEFYRRYESSDEGTSVSRVVPVKEAIPDEKIILAAEDAHRIVDDYPGDDIAFMRCPCRSRTEKLGIRECRDKFPVAYCVVFGFQAIYLDQEGRGKKITKEKAKKYMDEMVGLGLVISTDNHSDPTRAVICLCCNCCCSLLRGITRWDNLRGLARANFVAHVDDGCAACGTCEERCPVGAITVPDGADNAEVDESKCLGCGVCTVTCETEALSLKRLEREHIFETGRDLFKRIRAENKPGA